AFANGGKGPRGCLHTLTRGAGGVMDVADHRGKIGLQQIDSLANDVEAALIGRSNGFGPLRCRRSGSARRGLVRRRLVMRAALKGAEIHAGGWKPDLIRSKIAAFFSTRIP